MNTYSGANRSFGSGIGPRTRGATTNDASVTTAKDSKMTDWVAKMNEMRKMREDTRSLLSSSNNLPAPASSSPSSASHTAPLPSVTSASCRPYPQPQRSHTFSSFPARLHSNNTVATRDRPKVNDTSFFQQPNASASTSSVPATKDTASNAAATTTATISPNSSLGTAAPSASSYSSWMSSRNSTNNTTGTDRKGPPPVVPPRTFSPSSSSAEPVANPMPTASSYSSSSSEVEDLRRKLAESEAAHAKTREELENMKQRRVEARSRVLRAKQQQLGQLKATSELRQQQRRAPETNPRPQKETRGSRRMTNRKVTNHIDSVLTMMTTLEKAIATAEAGRTKAEYELIEYAKEMRGQEAAMQAINVELEKAMKLTTRLLDQTSTNQALNDSVLGLKTIIWQCQNLSDGSPQHNSTLPPSGATLLSPNVDRLHSPALRSRSHTERRPSGLGAGFGASVNVAPMPPPPMAPAPPPPSAMPFVMVTTDAAPGDGSGGKSLLQQIREGKDLNKIDLDAMLKQQKLRKRRSSCLIASLAETLRKAMGERRGYMGEEDGEEDGDDGDDGNDPLCDSDEEWEAYEDATW
ncbi:hypothetical protein QOT17_012293 [Balamuthia mandrillaris]